MKRRLLNVLTVFSLLISAAAGALCARSYGTEDVLTVTTGGPRTIVARSAAGSIVLTEEMTPARRWFTNVTANDLTSFDERIAASNAVPCGDAYMGLPVLSHWTFPHWAVVMAAVLLPAFRCIYPHVHRCAARGFPVGAATAEQ